MPTQIQDIKKGLLKLNSKELKEIEDYLASLRDNAKIDNTVLDFHSALKELFGVGCPTVHDLIKTAGPKKLQGQVLGLTKFIQSLTEEPFGRLELAYAYRLILSTLRTYLEANYAQVMAMDVMANLDKIGPALNQAFPGYHGRFLALVLRPRKYSQTHIQPLVKIECEKCGGEATHKIINAIGGTVEYRCQRCAYQKEGELNENC